MNADQVTSELGKMTRAELHRIARILAIPQYRKLRKADLIRELVSRHRDVQPLIERFPHRDIVPWYHHLYGTGQLIVGITTIVLMAIPFFWPDVVRTVGRESVLTGTEADHRESQRATLKRLEIEQDRTVLRQSTPDLIHADEALRKNVALLPEPDYSGFEVLREEHIWDLRAWKDLEDVQLHSSELISGAVLKSRIRLRRTSEEALVYTLPAMTSGVDIFTRCDSHPRNCIVYAASDDLVEVSGTLLKKRVVEIDVSQHAVGVPFSIELTRTYWNGNRGHWAGTIIRQDVLLISFLILFPDDKPYRTYDTVQARVDSELPPTPIGDQLVIDGGENTYVFWQIVEPPPDHVYRIDWHW